MPVISTDIDQDALSLVALCEFDAPPEHVWSLWADPRQFERWWSPPDWPAIVVREGFAAGERREYRMTGADGTSSAVWMQWTTLVEPRHLRFTDGFIGDDGRDDPSMPVCDVTVDLEALEPGRTRMSVVFRYAKPADLAFVIEVGMIEGFRAAAGQIEGVLAA